MESRRIVCAREALQRLQEGNARFVANARTADSIEAATHRSDLTAGQSPFATVLGCSDSRVPAEIVFDCGLGELFVVRVAGNIVAPSLVGSVEFAAVSFDTQLVVVMGHTRCGAIAATIANLQGKRSAVSDNIYDICERIEPSVRELVDAGLTGDRLIAGATRANIRASVSHLRHGSRLIEQRIAAGNLTVVGAEYSLESGHVDFFDTLPPIRAD